MARIVTLGEAMVTFATTNIGPLPQATSAAVSVAGSEATVAVGLARLGHSVAWFSSLGDDSLGDLVLSKIRGAGVDVIADRRASPTGILIKERRTAHTRSVSYRRAGSAASTLAPHDLPADLIESADILHLTGITPALSASCAQLVHEAVARARKAGTLVSLDLNIRRLLWSEDQARIGLAPLIAQSDVIFASVDEAQLVLSLGDEDPPAEIAAALAGRDRRAVVTDGPRGAWFAGDGEGHQPAFPAQEVDPFGAGDAFVAGFLSTIADGGSAADAARNAAAVAAIAVSCEGDWEGLPTQREVAALTRAESIQR